MGRLVYFPGHGYSWNPLHNIMQRNDYCVCGSSKKWKKCCKDRIPMIIPTEVAEKMSNYTKDVSMMVEIHDEGINEWNAKADRKEKLNESGKD